MRAMLLVVPFAFLFACGGGTSNQAPAEVDLNASGASTPTSGAVNISVPSGGQIHFVNKDTANHQIASSNCAELNTTTIAPAATVAITIVSSGPCTFHDALNPAVAGFNGTITVTAPGTPGNGY
jgi:hypothetical protein